MSQKTFYEIINSSEEEILHIIENKELYYLSFPIHKAKGKIRWIDAPQGRLKEIQKKILYNYFYHFKANKNAYGYIYKKSAVEGAKRHIGQKILMNIDIENFFSSIKIGMVNDYIPNLIKKINYSSRSRSYSSGTSLIPSLVTFKGKLPQGACTSPAISNIVFAKVDKLLDMFATDNKLIYTRYVDDITFSSSDKNINIFNIYTSVKQILREYGFKINVRKTNIVSSNHRMMVTGIVVNEQLGVPKYIWKNLRARLHQMKTLTRKDYESIKGKIEWITRLNSNRGKQLHQMLGKIALEN